LIFDKEKYDISEKLARDYDEKTSVSLGRGHSESQLHSRTEKREPGMNNLCQLLEFFRVYHLNDTSMTAPIRQNTMFGNLMPTLREGANNLAYILYLQKQQAPNHYTRIVETIQQVLPWFKDFVFKPDPQGLVQLLWRGEDPDYVFSSHQTPDGVLRAMAIITLLHNSIESRIPQIIAIDEPELGLHPHAISVIAALMHLAAARCQLFIATQSISMLDEFDPENVVVVDYDADERMSVFHRLDEKHYADWLERYSLSELWEKNVIGGGPCR
jgi:predicted ATPase